MIDTHTHLYFPEYGDEIHAIMKKCADSGISHCILPNVDIESINQIKEFHKIYPESTSMAIGLHPTEVKDDWENIVDIIEKEISNDEWIAIGEIGMDLYWDQDYLEQQLEAFERQLQIAQEKKLPVIIHSRNALTETLQVIKKVNPNVPLIFHSFTGKKEDVKTIREVCDPYFGINGVVTYKNAPELREALSHIGLDRMVLETDAPFLSPVPHRGKRNDSSLIVHIRDKVAETLDVTPEKVETITDNNARKIFGL